MKINKRWFFILALIFPNHLFAQYDSSYFTRFYEQRLSFFEVMPNNPNEIIMLGNSITNGVSWSEIFNDIRIKNRGISGDNTFGLLARINEVTTSEPSKIFILIGINDIANEIPTGIIARNYEELIKQIQEQSPKTRIFLQSLFPTNNEFSYFPKAQNKDKEIKELNSNIRLLAKKYKTGFIDLHPLFCDQNGKLSKQYTNDGLHLLGKAYLIWANILRPYIYDTN